MQILQKVIRNALEYWPEEDTAKIWEKLVQRLWRKFDPHMDVGHSISLGKPDNQLVLKYYDVSNEVK